MACGACRAPTAPMHAVPMRSSSETKSASATAIISSESALASPKSQHLWKSGCALLRTGDEKQRRPSASNLPKNGGHVGLAKRHGETREDGAR
eukprot:1884459-Pleurochrysis_carterae.AAC.3